MLPVFANTAMTMAYMTTKLAGFLESGRHRRRFKLTNSLFTYISCVFFFFFSKLGSIIRQQPIVFSQTFSGLVLTCQ